MLWSQIFPWTLLGSAWSCLVVIRNDQKTFIYVFDNQGTGENNALDDNDEDSYDSWDYGDDDKNCVCADDYQLISTSNCRQQPLHSKSFFQFPLFAILQSPLESLHNLFPSQLLMKGRFSFSSNYQKEKKLQKQPMSIQTNWRERIFQEILRREIRKRPKWAEIAGVGIEKAKPKAGK